jgi:hypothetical protein
MDLRKFSSVIFAEILQQGASKIAQKFSWVQWLLNWW